MAGLSSPFKPQINTIRDAERITMRWLGIGVLAVILGLLLAPVDSSIGGMVLLFGVVLIPATVAWVVYISKANSIERLCPRCRHPNNIFAGEDHFRCSSCGYFAVFGEK